MMTGWLPVETPQGVGNSQEDSMEEIRFEAFKEPIQFSIDDQGLPVWADGCYVNGGEFMGYRECEAPCKSIKPPY